MSIFKRAKASAALSRAEEEAAFAAALREIESGTRRDGLWAKALAKSRNPEEAKGLYIKLRVQAFMDERNVAEYVAELEAAEQDRFDKQVIAGLEANIEAREQAEAERLELQKLAEEQSRAVESWERKPRLLKVLIQTIRAIWYLFWSIVLFGLIAFLLKMGHVVYTDYDELWTVIVFTLCGGIFTVIAGYGAVFCFMTAASRLISASDIYQQR